MLSKDTEWLKREAKLQIAEAQRERMHGMVASQEERQDAVTAADGKFDVTSFDQQVGKPMTGLEVQRRIKMLNPGLSFEVSRAFPDRDNVLIKNETGRRYLFSMENGLNPERSVKDSRGICVMKGWRTVLVQLIKERAITVQGAERLFDVNNGFDTPNWYKDLS